MALEMQSVALVGEDRAYLDFVRYFLDARDGTLPVQYEPET